MHRMRTILAAAAILFAAVGCDNKPAPTTAPAPMPSQPTAAGPKAKDPVCNMEVAADAPLAYEHEGKTYRFCAQQCLDKFKAEPSKYLK